MIKKEKELWLKFKDQSDYLEKEAKVLNILKRYEGTIKTIIYLEKTKHIKRLNKWTGKEAAEEIKEILGESSVKIIEKEIKDYTCDSELDPLERIAKTLERIADNLENINCTLINIGGSVELLEKVSDCISENPYGSFLCITGNVSADAR